MALIRPHPFCVPTATPGSWTVETPLRGCGCECVSVYVLGVMHFLTRRRPRPRPEPAEPQHPQLMGTATSPSSLPIAMSGPRGLGQGVMVNL